ncbi:MAG: imidazoleglycerol-phosphate dehydratase HisB [Candidatus Pacebacteria bacterium]|nr:imidazoleglycerol-phosphate dehydratase HisB [Candidatus Paceibacterota bacterium]
MAKRTAKVTRETSETAVTVEWTVDGAGRSAISTGIPFADHMLTSLARHGCFDLDVDADGDLEVDAHHTLEDIGLTLGQALRQALGDRKGIRRFGAALVPMDEALAEVSIDICGRPFLAYDVKPVPAEAGGLNTRLFREFFQGLTTAAGLVVHITARAGDEPHHMLEAVFKAVARALDEATQIDSRCTGVPSTKGSLD